MPVVRLVAQVAHVDREELRIALDHPAQQHMHRRTQKGREQMFGE
jgi:hypothetical protein